MSTKTKVIYHNTKVQVPLPKEMRAIVISYYAKLSEEDKKNVTYSNAKEFGLLDDLTEEQLKFPAAKQKITALLRNLRNG